MLTPEELMGKIEILANSPEVQKRHDAATVCASRFLTLPKERRFAVMCKLLNDQNPDVIVSALIGLTDYPDHTAPLLPTFQKLRGHQNDEIRELVNKRLEEHNHIKAK